MYFRVFIWEYQRILKTDTRKRYLFTGGIIRSVLGQGKRPCLSSSLVEGKGKLLLPLHIEGLGAALHGSCAWPVVSVLPCREMGSRVLVGGVGEFP
jgi:hypothetical protein